MIWKILFTYGDGISNVDIDELTKFHYENNKLVTVTAVSPPPRFGDLEIEGNLVTEMREKMSLDQLINGGYFVVSGKIIEFLNKDEPFEQTPLRTIAKKMNSQHISIEVIGNVLTP